MNYVINEQLYEKLPKYVNTSKGIIFSPEHLSEEVLNDAGIYLTNIIISGSNSLYTYEKVSNILKNGSRFDVYVVYSYKDLEEIRDIKIDLLKKAFETYKETLLESIDENEFKKIVLQSISKLAQGKDATNDALLSSIVNKSQNYSNNLQKLKDKIQQINNSNDIDFIVNL